jgi:hypothetical protein
VTAGYRVVLTYDLMVDGDMPRTIGSAAAGHLDALARSIERFFGTPRRSPSTAAPTFIR